MRDFLIHHSRCPRTQMVACGNGDLSWHDFSILSQLPAGAWRESHVAQKPSIFWMWRSLETLLGNSFWSPPNWIALGWEQRPIGVPRDLRETILATAQGSALPGPFALPRVEPLTTPAAEKMRCVTGVQRPTNQASNKRKVKADALVGWFCRLYRLGSRGLLELRVPGTMGGTAPQEFSHCWNGHLTFGGWFWWNDTSWHLFYALIIERITEKHDKTPSTYVGWQEFCSEGRAKTWDEEAACKKSFYTFVFPPLSSASSSASHERGNTTDDMTLVYSPLLLLVIRIPYFEASRNIINHHHPLLSS